MCSKDTKHLSDDEFDQWAYKFMDGTNEDKVQLMSDLLERGYCFAKVVVAAQELLEVVTAEKIAAKMLASTLGDTKG